MEIPSHPISRAASVGLAVEAALAPAGSPGAAGNPQMSAGGRQPAGVPAGSRLSGPAGGRQVAPLRRGRRGWARGRGRGDRPRPALPPRRGQSFPPPSFEKPSKSIFTRQNPPHQFFKSSFFFKQKAKFSNNYFFRKGTPEQR